MLNQIYKQIAKTLNLPEKVVKETYRAYWYVIKLHLSLLPLKEELTEEEFSNLLKSVNIERIGKIYVTYNRYLKNYNKFSHGDNKDN